MGFLTDLLQRPATERPFLLIPIGYPTGDCQIPEAALDKKPLDDILTSDP